MELFDEEFDFEPLIFDNLTDEEKYTGWKRKTGLYKCVSCNISMNNERDFLNHHTAHCTLPNLIIKKLSKDAIRFRLKRLEKKRLKKLEMARLEEVSVLNYFHGKPGTTPPTFVINNEMYKNPNLIVRSPKYIKKLISAEHSYSKKPIKIKTTIRNQLTMPVIKTEAEITLMDLLPIDCDQKPFILKTQPIKIEPEYIISEYEQNRDIIPNASQYYKEEKYIPKRVPQKPGPKCSKNSPYKMKSINFRKIKSIEIEHIPSRCEQQPYNFKFNNEYYHENYISERKHKKPGPRCSKNKYMKPKEMEPELSAQYPAIKQIKTEPPESAFKTEYIKEYVTDRMRQKPGPKALKKTPLGIMDTEPKSILSFPKIRPISIDRLKAEPTSLKNNESQIAKPILLIKPETNCSKIRNMRITSNLKFGSNILQSAKLCPICNKLFASEQLMLRHLLNCTK